jgi:hypothetical protein
VFHQGKQSLIVLSICKISNDEKSKHISDRLLNCRNIHIEVLHVAYEKLCDFDIVCNAAILVAEI